MKARGDYIGGKFVRPRNSDGTLLSLDPGDTDRILGEFPVFHSSPERALSAARAAQAAWGAEPQNARVATLQKIRAELRNRSEDLVATLSAETGRPVWESRAEVRAMYGVLDGMLHYGLAELTMREPPPGESQVDFQPLGTVVILSPYPQPCLLMHADAVAAMGAGCTVVCKPSEYTPAAGQIYAEILHEADLPRGVFNLVQGDASTGAVLAGSSITDGVLFCGSEKSGRTLLAQLAAAPGKVVRAILSGHAAALVLDDANLDEAAYKIVIGACTGSGQRCTSTRRVVVARRVAEPLVARLVYLLQNLKIGYATDPDTFMGPLIRPEVVEAYLRDIERVGGSSVEELVQGAPLTTRRRGSYVTPSLHRMTTASMAATSDQEAIGPLLSLALVEELEEGVELINRSAWGLVMSVFCRSSRALDRVRQVQGTGLCLHNLPTTKWPAKLPICPRGRSGNGVPAGILTPRVCTRLVVNVDTQEALDLTMLPPGIPRDLG